MYSTLFLSTTYLVARPSPYDLTMRIASIFIFVLAFPLLMFGQNATDALRYSMTESVATARNTALGGAMGAIGADFGILNVNPAGLGAYRSSEFMLSFGVFAHSTDSELIDGGVPAATNNGSRFTISNIGIVFSNQPRNKSWKASNFAIGYSRLNDYNQTFAFSGRNPGSITDRWAQNANFADPPGIPPEQLNAFEEALAYETGAIYDLDEQDGDWFYVTDYELNPNANLLRRQTVDRTGGQGEILLSYGANYNEKLLFGVTVGIPILNYDEEKNYEEEDLASDAVPFFNALRFEETLQTSGNGFNVKLGATYKVGKYFNVGAAYHSRTRYSLTDNFSTRITYDYTIDEERFVFTAPFDGPQEGNFNYNMSSPWAVLGNMSYVITIVDKKTMKKERIRKKEDAPRLFLGFLTAQFKYIDFSKARYDYSGRGNGDQFQFEEDLVNESIRNTLSQSLQMNFGAEYALGGLRVRGGLAMIQSPFEGDDTFNNTYSVGLGYRFERIFIDFAYQWNKMETLYIPYNAAFVPISEVENTTRLSRFILTAGYKWL